MRTVNFQQDVLNAIAALLSITPNPDLSPEFAAQFTAFVNTRLRFAWSYYDWPELYVTEERAFRPVWRNDQNYFEGDEVYFLPNQAYNQALQDVIEGVDPTNTTFWEPLEPIDKYIEYDQMGQQPIGEVYGVYNINPRIRPGTDLSGLRFRPSEKGIDVYPYSGPTVFIRYKIPVPQFTTTPWVQGTYTYGQTAFFTDGNCYQVGVASTTAPPTNISQWFPLPFPYVLAEYVKTAAAGDAADDQATEALLLQESESYLQQEVNRLMAQGLSHHYNLHRRRHDHYRWGYWVISPPLAVSGFVSMLTDALYSPLEQDRRVYIVDELGDAVIAETGDKILIQ